jgi:hypothetical protein
VDLKTEAGYFLDYAVDVGFAGVGLHTMIMIVFLPVFSYLRLCEGCLESFRCKERPEERHRRWTFQAVAIEENKYNPSLKSGTGLFTRGTTLLACGKPLSSGTGRFVRYPSLR